MFNILLYEYIQSSEVMSDSEAEFESADEGSKDEDGWEIESDFDLPDVKSVSVEYKPTETNLSALPNFSENVNTKHSEINDACNEVSMVQSKLDKLDVNSTKSESEVSEVIQNEIKQTSTQTTVSKIIK